MYKSSDIPYQVFTEVSKRFVNIEVISELYSLRLNVSAGNFFTSDFASSFTQRSTTGIPRNPCLKASESDDLNLPNSSGSNSRYSSYLETRKNEAAKISKGRSESSDD